MWPFPPFLYVSSTISPICKCLIQHSQVHLLGGTGVSDLSILQTRGLLALPAFSPPRTSISCFLSHCGAFCCFFWSQIMVVTMSQFVFIGLVSWHFLCEDTCPLVTEMSIPWTRAHCIMQACGSWNVWSGTELSQGPYGDGWTKGHPKRILSTSLSWWTHSALGLSASLDLGPRCKVSPGEQASDQGAMSSPHPSKSKSQSKWSWAERTPIKVSMIPPHTHRHLHPQSEAQVKEVIGPTGNYFPRLLKL